MPERVISGPEFLAVLCDQTLLCQIGNGEVWTWPPRRRHKAYVEMGHKSIPIVAGFLDAILEACRHDDVVLAVHYSEKREIMPELTRRTSDKCPLFEQKTIEDICGSARFTLGCSPQFAEPFTLRRHLTREDFRFERADTVMRIRRFEHVR